MRTRAQRSASPERANASASASESSARLDADAAVDQVRRTAPGSRPRPDSRSRARAAPSSSHTSCWRRSGSGSIADDVLRDTGMPGHGARTARSVSAHGPAASVSRPSASYGCRWRTRAPSATDARAASASSSGVRGIRGCSAAAREPFRATWRRGDIARDDASARSGVRRRTRARGSRAPRRRRRSARSGRRPPIASSMSRCDASGSCQPVSRPSTARTPRPGVITSSVQPSAGADACRPRRRRSRAPARPWSRPRSRGRPSCAWRSTSRAVEAGTRYHSGYGRSPSSSDETPVCRVTGAIATPRATSAVISSGVNGRPALGISALPGWRA